MILLDTNVLIYASTDGSPFFEWARHTIAVEVSEDGAAVRLAACDSRRGTFPNLFPFSHPADTLRAPALTPPA